MNAWDIVLPHRLLVNRSLRRASDELRSRIDDYQFKYDREIERCATEIEQAKADKDHSFESVKLSLIDELSQDNAFFEAVQAGLFKYVDLYFRRQCLNKVRDIKTLEMQSLIEHSNFLSEQMRLIGEEINLLEVRKDRLVLQAKVNDVIELIGLSGYAISITDEDDAKTLLVRIAELLDDCDDSDWLIKHSLLRLRAVLQERVDLLPIIQYISWTIQQKILLSRQLSKERRKISEDKNDKTNELRQISENLDMLNHSLDEQARTVRDYWAIPITQLNVQISFNDSKLKSLFESVKNVQAKLNELFSELKDTNQQIQQMINSRSDDSWKWERLQRQKADYKNDISSTKSKIDTMQNQISQLKSEMETQKNTRKQWLDRRQMVYSLCKRNSVYLISDKNSQESDESRIINSRLMELYQVEEEIMNREKERFKQESTQINQRRKEKVDKLSAQIASAEKNQIDKQTALGKATQQLSSSKSRDARFFLLKVFSDTDEVNKAKIALQAATTHKKEADTLLTSLKAELAAAIADFDRQLITCRPKPYKPTVAESEERKRLENRKTELLDKNSKMKSAHKEVHRED